MDHILRLPNESSEIPVHKTKSSAEFINPGESGRETGGAGEGLTEVAGEVDTVSPPPQTPGTGEYRCIGCCKVKVTIPGKSASAPKISNRLSGIHFPSEGFRDLGTEPNAINDRCLGCCDDGVTLGLRVTTVTKSGTTGGSGKGVTAGNQRPRQQERGYEPPCTPPKCRPDWRYEASSSSEEMPVIRRQRLHPALFRTGTLCRHRGCRSALGAGQDSSSSSEED
ncbi:uncharacterized protein LOC142652630 [Rhinoderma darwinii]|uniref:uncharacterized protein LOC142652630 n=1 Tax=Rhinoderma darwinii TaxID=43563 RepID=UPI003F672D05